LFSSIQAHLARNICAFRSDVISEILKSGQPHITQYQLCACARAQGGPIGRQPLGFCFCGVFLISNHYFWSQRQSNRFFWYVLRFVQFVILWVSHKVCYSILSKFILYILSYTFYLLQYFPIFLIFVIDFPFVLFKFVTVFSFLFNI